MKFVSFFTFGLTIHGLTILQGSFRERHSKFRGMDSFLSQSNHSEKIVV